MTRLDLRTLVVLPYLLCGLLAPTSAFASAPASDPAVPLGVDPMTPADIGTLADLDLALARLSTHKRLLVMAAHPDDEDTALLTYVARALGGESAYLSLTRGDGGQNLIGDELGEGLGLLRSRELEAARTVDGARQFFTRAYDFGYTRSLEETFERWPTDVLLEDALRVVHRFKPQVLVAIFPPDARAGHGQHQASSVMADQVFEECRRDRAEAASDDASASVCRWPIDSHFRASFFLPDAPATLTVPLGTIEPYSGRSIFQIAMESRSQHRCQDMGLLQPLGDADDRLLWVAGVGEEAEQLFDGIDTSLPALADPLADADLRREVAVRLDAVERLATEARGRLGAHGAHGAATGAGEAEVVGREAAVAPLVEIVRTLHEIEKCLAGAEPSSAADGVGVRQVAELVAEKRTIAEEALASAAGLGLDAFTDLAALEPGAELQVRLQVWDSAGRLGAAGVDVDLGGPDGRWKLVAESRPGPPRGFFATTIGWDRLVTVAAPRTAAPTVPYHLRAPRQGDLYDWSGVDESVRGEPFAPPPLVATFRLEVDGVPLTLRREVVQRVRDQARGEVRAPLRVVPGAEVSIDRDLVVWSTTSPADDSSGLEPEVTKLEITVRAVASTVPLFGELHVEVPEGWPAVDSVRLAVPPSGHVTTRVPLVLPADPQPGRYQVEARFEAWETRFERALELIDYEHIRPVPRPVDAVVEVTVDDIALPDVQAVGYVRGASDVVPERLADLGLPIHVLDAAELADADLSRYDAIVVGSRAYEVEPALARANERLLDYARGGGLVIVQYQQYQYVGGGFAPYPLDISRPHDRVTDEASPVRVLVPDHPLLTTPNRITDADWDGWVQERGLYFAGTWDAAWTPILALRDPGREEVEGGLLVADVGEGHYIYTGLAFFRQLPAGVPGAYRLLMNLIGY